MSTQSTLTVTGFVGSDVRYSPGENGSVPYAQFRLGSTPRVFDRGTQQFRDRATQWYTVKVWRHVARNVAESLHKGQPVVVTGRLVTEEWASPDGPRTSLVIEATALGHDLVFGWTRFTRIVGESSAAGVTEEASPVDVTALPEATVLDDDGFDEDELDDDEVGDEQLAGSALVG